MKTLSALALCGALMAAEPASLWPQAPLPDAIVLGSPQHPLPAPPADAGPAIQAGIDNARGGLVFLASGTWHVQGSLNLWKGVRLIGVGPSRPELVLPPRTPGFAGPAESYLVTFRSDKPKPGAAPADANNDTFGSALINLRFVLGEGNPGAWAVRYRVAQLCAIDQVDFALAPGTGGIRQAANVIRGCTFTGGTCGIATDPPIAWQVLISDCTFTGQSVAAVRSEHAGIMAMRCRISGTPVGFQVPAGKADMLWLEDIACRDVGALAETDADGGPFQAVTITRSAGIGTPTLVARRDAPPLAAPAPDWRIARFHHGLRGGSGDAAGGTRGSVGPESGSDEPRAPLAPEVRAGWTLLGEHGAVGDGTADCTAALRAALATGRPVLVPPGRYRLSDTVDLPPGAVLQGLHPRGSMFVLAAGTPGFGDASAPRALLRTATDDAAQVGCLGFDIAANPGATVVHWRSGRASRLADVWTRPNKAGGPGIELLVEGSGTFANLWLVQDAARHALVLRNASGGRVELASLEHHTPEELVVEGASDWLLAGIQTERGEQEAPAVTIRTSRGIRFANAWLYRTSSSRQPRDAAAVVDAASAVEWEGLRVYAGAWRGGVPHSNAVRIAGGAAYGPLVSGLLRTP